MTYQCENCGQPALEGDTICWHCGWRFPRRETSKKPAPKVTRKPGQEQPFSLTAVSVYAGLTILTIMAALLVMRSLGQKPLVTINLEALNPGWIPVTDQAQNFTFDIPAGWVWLEKENRQPAEFEQLVEARAEFREAVAPFSHVAADLELLMIVTSEQATEAVLSASAESGFLVIARSVRLNQFSPEQTIALLQQNAASADVLEASVAESFNGQQQAAFLLELPHEGGKLRCREQFTPGQVAGFLIAACAPGARYAPYNNEFQDILASFQLLSP